MMNVKNLQESCEQAANKVGVKKYDFFASQVEESVVKVQGGKPSSMSESQRTSGIVRVWDDRGAVGVTSTSDVTPLGIEKALTMARDVASICDATDAPDFSPAAKNNLLHSPQSSVEKLAPTQEALAMLLDAEEKVMKGCKFIKSLPYNALSQKASARAYMNSEGALRSEMHNTSFAYLYALANRENAKPRSGGHSVVANTLQKLNLKECIDVTLEKTESFLDYKTIPSGTYTVVFKPEAFLSLVDAFDNIYNAQNILDKQSLSKPDSLGQSIASDLLTIADDACHPGNIGASAFDSEGTPTARTTLIEAGVLKNFLHSAGTAKRMGAKPTGHAHIGAKVSISPHFFVVEAAKKQTERDPLKEDKIIIIDSLNALHAGVNALQGSFSLPFDGWIVENGKITSLDSVTVAGDVLSVFKNIIYVSEKAELTPSGVSPDVWVTGLSITGA